MGLNGQPYPNSTQYTIMEYHAVQHTSQGQMLTSLERDKIIERDLLG
jgi:hypothetical protein